MNKSLKFFFLTCIFFYLVNSLKLGFDLGEGQLIHLYRKATDYYSKNPNFPVPRYYKLHIKLIRLVLNSFREDPKGFLELIRQKESRPLAHFVFLVLSYKSCDMIWIEHSDLAYSPFKFFERAKDLAFSLNIGKDWNSHKEVLSVLWTIQEQYLPHLNSKVHDIGKVKEWMRIQQEIISYPHDLCSNETLLQLFYQLQSLARRYKEEIPENGRIKSSIEGLLQLFYYSLQYLFSDNWETSDITQFPPKLLYVATLNLENRHLFHCLKNPKSFSSLKLDLFSSQFRRIRAIYEIEFRTRITSPFQAFQANSKFLKFLRLCIEKKKEYPFNLEKKDFWFIEIILYISSNLHDSNSLIE
jgi:hypothetical protein